MKNFKEIIINAWKTYSTELDYNKINQIEFGDNQFQITESEFLYSIVRHVKPKIVIEASPDKGFTSVVIMEALKHNNIPCKLYSFDIHDKSLKHNKKDGIIKRELIIGDARNTITIDLIKEADFIFIDSDHSYEFAKDYCKKLESAKPGTYIMIHDWPMYDSNGACDNVIPEKAPFSRPEELAAVKKLFIEKGFAMPVLNVTDFLKEIGKPYYRSGFRALSPSQIIVKI